MALQLGILCLVAAAAVGADGAAAMPQPPTQKKVLVVHASRPDAPYTVLVDEALRTTLAGALGGRLDYYTEYVDLARFSGRAYGSATRDFLQRKYGGLHLDVVIAEGAAPFDFLVQHRAELFGDVPLIFSREGGPVPRLPNAAGVVFPVDMRSTLDLALGLAPDTTSVAVVVGSSAFDRFYETLARQQFRDLERRASFTYLSGLAIRDVSDTLRRLPPHSLVFFVSLFEDGAGERFIPVEALTRLSEAANAPVYCWPEMTLGHGVVGGHLLSEAQVARETANVALRVLRGERADSIGIREIRPYVFAFDSRQLRRWGIGEDRLPAGAIVHFKEGSFWTRFRWRIIGAFALMVAQGVLIVGLLVSRRRRARAEHALRDSHDRVEGLARRLIVAQEEERKHVARELHDDLSQDAAALVLDLTTLERRLGKTAASHAGGLAALRQSATELCHRIHSLSHDLHSATLEHAGLRVSLIEYCEEFERRHGIVTHLRLPDAPERLGEDAELCLYRIAQEALTNVAKHAHATTVDVTLAGANGRVGLRVVDDGAGFEPGHVRTKSGIGLVGMEERAKLLGGTLTVTSAPGAGTHLSVEIEVRSPPRHRA